MTRLITDRLSESDRMVLQELRPDRELGVLEVLK